MNVYEEVYNYISFNCQFCKNRKTCDLYKTLSNSDSKITHVNIPDCRYECPNLNKESGVRLTSHADTIKGKVVYRKGEFSYDD